MNENVAKALIAGAAFLGLYCPLLSARDVELDKVREMLRLDTERALAAERSRQGAGNTGTPSARAVRRSDKLELASIYGLRGALTAVVLVNGEPKVFRQGLDSPQGATSSSADYRLQRIEGGCVYLRKGASERSACIDAAARLPRPAAAVPVANSPAAFPVPVPPPVIRP